jgi:RHS repeat-associated protein
MDGVHVILEKEIVGEEAPITKARYIPGVCMITKDNEANEVIRYYHEDALGSFIAMTDENQNITALYQSDAWGNELFPQVSALSPPPSENPYRWCGAWGYYFDSDLQMYLLGMRWHDPQTGRFISRDPIGFVSGDFNLGRYGKNNSINRIDPTGLQDPTKEPFHVWMAKFRTLLANDNAASAPGLPVPAGPASATGVAAAIQALPPNTTYSDRVTRLFFQECRGRAILTLAARAAGAVGARKDELCGALSREIDECAKQLEPELLLQGPVPGLDLGNIAAIRAPDVFRRILHVLKTAAGC